MERLKKIGNVKACHSSEVRESVIGIGFEKLDRGVFDPEKAYDKVAATGCKWARIQSGWMRTEKTKGVYDFEWIDNIVDNLLKRGMQPWMCICYGNPLYDDEAAKVFGAVGCPPRTEEQFAAWSRYCTALANHFKGRISWYEVWNEPDGQWCWKHGPSGTEYGELFKATAIAVKAGDPDAKMIGGCQCCFGLQWTEDVFATGAGELMDAYSYHNYFANEKGLVHLVQALRAVCHRYNPAIRMIQGETGAQSRSDGCGALRGMAWTPLKQAKFMARHTVNDLLSDVMFCSYFSCMDMIEALHGTVGDKSTYLDYGYFGILAADFDENGVATGEYKPKLSYRTMQVLASVFREKFTREELPVKLFTAESVRMDGFDEAFADISCAGFSKPNQSYAFAYWKPTDLMKGDFESTVSMETALPGEVQLVDLLDGSIYEIPDSICTAGRGSYRQFRNLPVKDYPMLLTFGDFLRR